MAGLPHTYLVKHVSRTGEELAKDGCLKTLVLTLSAPLVDVINERAIISALDGKPHPAVWTEKGRKVICRRRWSRPSRGVMRPILTRPRYRTELNSEPHR
jgi:hypothetical protein